MKVTVTNHLDMLRWLRQNLSRVCSKPIFVAAMKFVGLTMHGESRQRSPQTFMICVRNNRVADCHKVSIIEFGHPDSTSKNLVIALIRAAVDWCRVVTTRCLCVCSIAVEQVFSKFLVPAMLGVDKRMKQLSLLYSTVDDHAKKW